MKFQEVEDKVFNAIVYFYQDCTPEEVRQHIKEKDGVEAGVSDDVYGCVDKFRCGDDVMKFYIYLESFKEHIFTHECVHLAYVIFNHKEVHFNYDCHEHFACYVEYWFKTLRSE